jgi:fucose 4-O-acetylase-like acetyltransferase
MALHLVFKKGKAPDRAVIMKNKRLSNVSVLRIMAFASVFLFHCFFFGTKGMAGVDALMLLSAAVQSFLFVSGFLYSQKDVSKKGFLAKEFKKIAFPCLGFLAVLTLADFAFMAASDRGISWDSCWWAFGSKDTDGGYVAQFGNLWYIPCLLICYFCLPLLQWVRGKAGVKGLVALLVAETVVEAVAIRFFGEPPVGFPFVAGYLVGSVEFADMTDPSRKKGWLWYSAPLALTAVSVVGWMTLGHAYQGLIPFFAEPVRCLACLTQGFVGIFAAMTVLRAFRWLNAYPEPAPLRFVGGLAFWLYIVHEAFMCGCFDLLHGCGSLPLGMLAAFAASLLAALCFSFAGDGFRRLKGSPSCLKLAAR